MLPVSISPERSSPTSPADDQQPGEQPILDTPGSPSGEAAPSPQDADGPAAGIQPGSSQETRAALELVWEECAAMLRGERAEWESERRQLMEKDHALLEHHAMQTADLTAAVQLLQRQLQASTAAPSGVQPGAALLEFQAKHCLEHVESRNEDNWNLLHLAAVATLDTPGMLPIIKDLLRCLPIRYLAEVTSAGRPGKPDGFTPLHLLCQGADPLGVRLEAIPLLIAAKAPLEPHNNPKGATPLLVAAGSAFLPAVRALVNGKADINAAKMGGTPRGIWPMTPTRPSRWT